MKNLRPAIILVLITILFNHTYATEKHEDPKARNEWLQSTYENKNVVMPIDFKQKQKQFLNTLPNAPEGLFTKGSKVTSQTWMHAGPDNVGGRTRAIAFDRTNSKILIAGSVSGGIWRSVDGGNSWTQTTGKEEVASVTTIIQDPRPGKNNIWYCAGGEYIGNSASMGWTSWYTGNGIYKSTDNGLTWKPYGKTGDNQAQDISNLDFVYKLAIDPTNTEEDILYMACIGTVYRISENGNKIENAINLDGFQAVNTNTDIVITPNGNYYITLSYLSESGKASHQGIFYSQDGYNWEDISPVFLQPSYRIVMDVFESDENILYFFSANIEQLSTGCDQRYEGCYSLFKYNKNNSIWNQWTNLSSNMPYFKVKHSVSNLETMENYCMAVKVHPKDTNLVFIAGANCFVSYDGFQSNERTQWIAGYNPDYDPNLVSNPEEDPMGYYNNEMTFTFGTGGWDFHYFVFNPDDPDEIISASDGGIHKLKGISEASDKTWTSLNSGYHTTQYYYCSIDKKKAGSEDILGGLQDNSTLGNLASSDKNNFSPIYGGDGMSSYFTSYGSVVVSSQVCDIVRLDINNGEVKNFKDLTPNSYNQLHKQFYTLFCVNPNGDKELTLTAKNAIVVCDDISTDDINAQYHTHFIDNLDATCCEYFNNDSGEILVGTMHSQVVKVTNTSRQSFEYEVIKLPDFVSGYFISNVWGDPYNNNHFVAIVSNYLSLGMLETYDNGKTWTDNGGNLEENPDGSGAGSSFRRYERMVFDGDTLHLLGTSDGLFSTKQLNGENTVWMREGANTIGRAVIADLEVRELDGRIVVATHGNGLFKTNYSTSVDEFNGQNLGFATSEVFPNPASSEINFVINSDKAAEIDVKLMDLNGNEIATLFSDKIVGTKKIKYNISQLSAGTYFIYISTDKYYVTKKVNIVK